MFFVGTLPILVIWGFGSPLYFFWEARKRILELAKSRSNGRKHVIDGIFLEYYRREWYFWESLVYIQKFLLLLTNGVIGQENLDIKVSCIVIILSIYYFISILIKPARFKSVNDVEGYSFIVIIMSILLGNLSVSEEAGPITKVILTIAMYIANLIYILIWGKRYAISVINEYIVDYPRLAKYLQRYSKYLRDVDIIYE
eukprot:TRINITY_DN12924_c0_g1_i1.p1 TRINITY_DN12924_c0_g1~~TRINITY_DN12924_c0_g1_i1.p1  ORF type:complete len:199 (+),score=6.07 TRINITY_DN12924_c0_g1_i1:86-682(+)